MKNRKIDIQGIPEDAVVTMCIEVESKGFKPFKQNYSLNQSGCIINVKIEKL